MTKNDKEELQKMMILTFNQGFEELVIPRIEDMEERFDKKLNKMGKELREEFKKGQQSLSRDIEEIDIKVDQIIKENKDHGMRLEKVERIAKTN